MLKATMIGGGMSKFGKHTDRNLKSLVAEAVGLALEDVDLVEVHDATAMGEISSSESLLFCPEGEGGVFGEAGHSTLGTTSTGEGALSVTIMKR